MHLNLCLNLQDKGYTQEGYLRLELVIGRKVKNIAVKWKKYRNNKGEYHELSAIFK